MGGYAKRATLLRLLGFIAGIAVLSMIWFAARASWSKVQTFDYQTWYPYVISWAGLFIGLGFVFSQWRKIGRLFDSRRVRIAAIILTSVCAATAVLVARRQARISDQVFSALAPIDAPLEISVFDQPYNFQDWRDRLEAYKIASANISTAYIDPDRQPAAAQQNSIAQYGTVLFRYKERTTRVTSNNDADLLVGVRNVLSERPRTVMFLTGHGEPSLTSSDPSGYQSIATRLQQSDFTVKGVTVDELGASMAGQVLAIAGPRQDLTESEVATLERFVNGSGRVLLALDPPEGSKRPVLVHLNAFAQQWGFHVGNDLIIDVSGMGQMVGAGATVAVATNYPEHPITKDFKLLTAFNVAQSVSPTRSAAGPVPTTIVESSAKSWREDDPAALFSKGTEVTLDPKEAQGVAPIAAALSIAGTVTKADDGRESSTPTVRMIVIGDSDFVTNNMLGMQGNADLFLDMVSWLQADDTQISGGGLSYTIRNIFDWNRTTHFRMVLTLILVGFGLFVASASVYSERHTVSLPRR